MRYLGVDYGKKRVGLALSDEEGIMAFPYSVVENSVGLIEDIADICKEENVQILVIGESKGLDGVRNVIMDDIDKFVNGWREQSNLPIFLEPEFLTSHQAQKIQGMHDKIDASAAAIILQSYIDRHKSS